MSKSQKKHKQEPPKDPHLDVPSEANRDKHINFLEEEEKEEQVSGEARKQNEEVTERRKEWERGIEAGKEERKKDQKEEPPFQKTDLDEQEEY